MTEVIFRGQDSLPRSSTNDVLGTRAQRALPHSKQAKLCCHVGTFHERSQYFLRLWICGIGEVVKFTPLGLAFNVNGPSLTNTQVRQLLLPASHCSTVSHGRHNVYLFT